MLSSGKINISKNINQVIPCYQEAISIIQKIKYDIKSGIAPPGSILWKGVYIICPTPILFRYPNQQVNLGIWTIALMVFKF